MVEGGGGGVRGGGGGEGGGGVGGEGGGEGGGVSAAGISIREQRALNEYKLAPASAPSRPSYGQMTPVGSSRASGGGGRRLALPVAGSLRQTDKVLGLRVGVTEGF